MRAQIAMLAAIAGTAMPAAAHHSFAVYFDQAREVTVRGTITAFRFTNPHGLIVLDVADAEGELVSWRAETNAPVVLQRRGWTRTSLRPGTQVVLSGWQARDGSRYLRLREARDAQGRLVGAGAFGQNDD